MLHSRHPITEAGRRRGVPCRRVAARVTRVMHTQSQIHTLDAKKIRRACVHACVRHTGVRRENTDPSMQDCHHSWLTVPDGAGVRRARRVEGDGRAVGERRAESQMWRVTWSNREDLRLIGFHIGSMVSGPQNARYGGEISLRL